MPFGIYTNTFSAVKFQNGCKPKGVMMKKTIIGILLFLSVSLCFADGSVFELGVGYHGMINPQTRTFPTGDGEHPGKTPTDLGPISSFAINVAYAKYSENKIGFGIYLNFLMSQYYEFTPEGGETQIITKDVNKHTFHFSMDALLGPVFILYNTETIDVSMAVGAHWYYYLGHWIPELSTNSTFHQIGLGANVSGAYHFTSAIYAYGRFQLAYDLYSWYSTGGTAGKKDIFGSYGGGGGNRISSGVSAWNISPCIGLGYRF
jgi:hypothetical protein